LKHPNGRDYSTYDESSASFSFDQHFENQGGSLSNTLDQLYFNSTNVAYLFANDDTPDNHLASGGAHLKTVMAFNAQQGFWLIHSVPRFPVGVVEYLKNGYEYPQRETRYGQSFLCLTLSSTMFETVAKALYLDGPQIYDSNMPASFASAFPNFVQVINGAHSTIPNADVFSITTVGGRSYTLFAKTPFWGKELYEDLVAPTFKDGLFTETWLNGRGNLGSYCRPYSVMDIKHVRLPDGVDWKDSQDHAKWAITQNKTITCVGDINRQHGQFKRGGGTYCINDAKVYNAFKTLITEYNHTCHGNRPWH